MSTQTLESIASRAFDAAVAKDQADKKEEPAKEEEVKDTEVVQDEEQHEEGVEKDADESEEQEESEVDPEDAVEDEDEEEPAPVQLPPAQQYVYDKLPTITVRGRAKPGGDVKEFKIKVPEELPETFEFASARDAAIFNGNVSDQAYRANKLFEEYQQKEQDQKLADFQAQEAVDVRDDIKQLQKEGLLPKFKYASNDSRFNDDPSVQQVQKVLEYYNRKNAEYVNKGKMYRTPFYDAALSYIALNPEVKPQAKEDKKPADLKGKPERDKVNRAKKNENGSDANAKQRPRPARSISEILQRHAKDWED